MQANKHINRNLGGELLGAAVLPAIESPLTPVNKRAGMT